MDIGDINLKELIERETGNKFNRQGYIPCPFHNEKTPSLSVKFHPNINKYKFKCFGCDVGGDAIDFISNFKGIDFNASKKYLGMEVHKSKKEQLEDKVKSFIEWEFTKYREEQDLLGIFTFVNKDNDPIYFKAKFMDHKEGKKKHGYYHFENEKVKASRGYDEIPYNLYNTIEGIKKDYAIVVVEGEKDANTINSLLRNENYVATSFKGITKELSYFTGARIYVCSDTGIAGEQYKWKIYNELFTTSREFKFINLPGLKSLGNNKDVTDWIEFGHDKKDLLNAFNRSLDLKTRYELQQNLNGVFKWIYNRKDDDFFKEYITNFKIIEAKRMKFIDEDKEGIKLILKSNTGETFEKTGFSTVFDDTKSFKNFLGTMDLSFIGDIKALTEFKIWINKYFALENEEIHNGAKFIEKDKKLFFATSNGAISDSGIDISIKCKGNMAENLIDIQEITQEEFKSIRKHLFKFATSEKTISIIGTVINNLAIYQNKAIGNKQHHLLMIGESGSGKSTILDNVIAPILNANKNDIKSIGLTSPFGIIKSLSEGNYPLLLEEFKPSALDRFKISKLSEILRNSYDGTSVSRGNRSLETTEFKLDRPIIMAGEESYANNEKALIERSCIIYLSKNERTLEHTKAMKWLMDNQQLLNKLGRSLIDIILNLTIEEYSDIRKLGESKITELINRPLNTALNIYCGMQILNKLAIKLETKEFKGFEKFLIENIKTEVLEDGQEVNSVVETMLLTFNQMLEDSRVLNPECVFKVKNNVVLIKTSEMINLLYEHTTRFGTDVIPLKLKDFKKQAKKSGYILNESIPTKMKQVNGNWKTVRMDEYDIEKLRDLKMYEIVEPIFEVVTETEQRFEGTTTECPF
ncbi:CHC2 zinc finger domain-containing protein [Clostridium septicum]|uniref:CHC2 zinc finger domain-containing protein n=1 Tax=Clostridium septicum TaxID=1504 RepID=A0A9N7JNM9_CLOSE|nr:CHC2 zinc finger domain-containing protein [Clostridium septicum]AYE35289.1 DNA primase [Clostridium septicum]MDU1313917.1 CHC2 zinc finger domain-containing protein [Clostridium septicum]UEC20059.1 CHC2 zinc finger domain-containing protein [Clostridium septicum]USS01885.1 CHC2 zinc finger domain-containing protein [Clostridium septicum]